MALTPVRTDASAPTLAAVVTMSIVRTDARAPAFAALAASAIVGTIQSLASRFAGDAPLASMAVAVDLELCFDSAALAL